MNFTAKNKGVRMLRFLAKDLFDFIDPKAGKLLARELARLLKPGGAVYGWNQIWARSSFEVEW